MQQQQTGPPPQKQQHPGQAYQPPVMQQQQTGCHFRCSSSRHGRHLRCSSSSDTGALIKTIHNTGPSLPLAILVYAAILKLVYWVLKILIACIFSFFLFCILTNESTQNKAGTLVLSGHCDTNQKKNYTRTSKFFNRSRTC